MGTLARRVTVFAGAGLVAYGVFFVVVYLMLCEFTKAVE